VSDLARQKTCEDQACLWVKVAQVPAELAQKAEPEDPRIRVQISDALVEAFDDFP
jgi:hypothetical protein